eukprot:SAG11_NODE_2544_length_3236_cov_5.076187_2_plen_102_part_00
MRSQCRLRTKHQHVRMLLWSCAAEQKRPVTILYAIGLTKVVCCGSSVCQTAFGTDVGGVNAALLAVSAEAEFDSWLTVGVTDGNLQVLVDLALLIYYVRQQ